MTGRRPDPALRAPVTAVRDAGGWPMRAVRAVVFAGAGVGLAAAAHRLAGGMPARPAALAAAAAVLFVVALAVSNRERVGWQIVALVGVTQAGLHAAFALAPAHPDSAAAQSAGWARLLFCQHGAHHVTAAQVAAARAHLVGGPTAHMSTAHMPTSTLLSPAAMLAAHVVVAVVMAWWLRRGERAAWAAAQRLVSRLARAVVTPAFGFSRAVRAVADVWVPVRRVRGSGLAGRGPPPRGLQILLTA